jgi:hypothetical protein
MSSQLVQVDAVEPLKQLPKQSSKKILLTLTIIVALIAILAGGGVYATYYWQQLRIAQLTSELTKAKTVNQKPQSAAPQIHFIKGTGYPFIASGTIPPQIDINLGLPNNYQAIRYPSDNNNRGDAESALTDKYNDEIARWEIGDPNYGQSAPSQLAVIAIDQPWLATTTNSDTVRGYSADGISPTTPVNKATYVANVKSDSEKCSQDSKLGFTTNDHVFKICYSLSSGIESYDPMIKLTGYAEAQGQPLILTGYIMLEQGKTYNEETSRTLASNGQHNEYPQSTLDAAQQVIEALKQTTTTVTTRNQ